MHGETMKNHITQLYVNSCTQHILLCTNA